MMNTRIRRIRQSVRDGVVHWHLSNGTIWLPCSTVHGDVKPLDPAPWVMNGMRWSHEFYAYYTANNYGGATWVFEPQANYNQNLEDYGVC